MRLRTPLLGALGAVVLVATLAAPTPAAPLADDLQDRVIRACVQIATILDPARVRGDDGNPISMRGSGTIVDRKGLILTNAHVVARPKAGEGSTGQQRQWDRWGFSAGEYWNPSRIVTVLVTEDPQQPPQPRYAARVVAIDLPHDMAVLRVVGFASDRDALMAGKPPKREPPESLPVTPLPLGDSGKLTLARSIHVYGYPGAGGETITYTAGHVSGFVDVDRDGKVDWIKTDAVISGGNSGGTAVDDKGDLIGVPTQGNPGEVAMLGPSNVAKALIAKAPTGRGTGAVPAPTPGPPAPAPKFGEITFYRANAEGEPGERLAAFPGDTWKVFAKVRYEGMRNGTLYYDRWMRDGEEASRTKEEPWTGGVSGTVTASVWRKPALASGAWVFEALVHGKVVARAPFRIDPPAEGVPAADPDEDEDDEAAGVALYGTVTDRATNEPIAGAAVLLLRPGRKAQEVAEDLRQRRKPGSPGSVVLQRASTDDEGNYRLALPVAAGTYVMVFSARGYDDVSGSVSVLPRGDKVVTAELDRTR